MLSNQSAFIPARNPFIIDPSIKSDIMPKQKWFSDLGKPEFLETSAISKKRWK